MTTSGYSSDDHHKDVAVLHSMGYAQELSRRMHGFSNFAIAFSMAVESLNLIAKSRRDAREERDG